MVVAITNIEFLNNPARFSDQYSIKVTFSCGAYLPDDLEWKLIYVASPDNESLDQELDSIVVGPVPAEPCQFTFDASPPDPSIIPKEDVLGVAALIITGSYKDREFVRVGYYQNTEYDNEEMKETPPDDIMFDRLVREISSKPRVTRFQIAWDIGPTASSDTAMGAANSAPVPSADDLGGDEEEVNMKVDTDTKTPA